MFLCLGTFVVNTIDHLIDDVVQPQDVCVRIVTVPVILEAVPHETVNVELIVPGGAEKQLVFLRQIGEMATRIDHHSAEGEVNNCDADTVRWYCYLFTINAVRDRLLFGL